MSKLIHQLLTTMGEKGADESHMLPQHLVMIHSASGKNVMKSISRKQEMGHRTGRIAWARANNLKRECFNSENSVGHQSSVGRRRNLSQIWKMKSFSLRVWQRQVQVQLR